MEIGTILGFAIAAVVAMVAALFTKGAGPDRRWKGGRKDPVRNMFFREDGSWRRYGRLGIVLVFILLVYLGYVGEI